MLVVLDVIVDMDPVIVKVPVASAYEFMRPSSSCFGFRFGPLYWGLDKPFVPVPSFSFVDSNAPDDAP